MKTYDAMINNGREFVIPKKCCNICIYHRDQRLQPNCHQREFDCFAQWKRLILNFIGWCLERLMLFPELYKWRIWMPICIISVRFAEYLYQFYIPSALSEWHEDFFRFLFANVKHVFLLWWKYCRRRVS